MTSTSARVEPVDDLCAVHAGRFNAAELTLDEFRDQLRHEAKVVVLTRGCGWCGCRTEPLEVVDNVRACATCLAIRNRKAVEG